MKWSLVQKRWVIPSIPEHYLKAMKRVVRNANKNTSLTFDGMWRKNIGENDKLFDIGKMNAKRLKDKLKGETAYLVGYGPSLALNVDILKGKRGVVFASLHALKFLLEKGVKVDYCVLLDAQEKQAPFIPDDREKTKNITLLTAVTASPRAIGKWGGPVYFFRDDNLRYKCGIKNNLSSGGSVIGSAYSLAVNMGAPRVVLVGVDLCSDIESTGRQKYADMSQEDLVEDGGFIHCGIDGLGVQTTMRMFLYKLWLEISAGHIARFCKTIVTSGIIGAYPEGNLDWIEYMPLAEV